MKYLIEGQFDFFINEPTDLSFEQAINKVKVFCDQLSEIIIRDSRQGEPYDFTIKGVFYVEAVDFFDLKKQIEITKNDIWLNLELSLEKWELI